MGEAKNRMNEIANLKKNGKKEKNIQRNTKMKTNEIKMDMNEVHYQMFLHQHDTKEQVKAWVEGLMKSKNLQNLADHMCAMNHLGWHFKDDETRQQMFFGAYRNLQMWAYNGGNLSEEDSIALYGAVD